MKKLILILMVGLMSVACTDNTRAKNYGGTMTIDVPRGNKITNITWKGDDLWYSYRPFKSGETPETTIFKEESTYGIMSGTVIFKESN